MLRGPTGVLEAMTLEESVHLSHESLLRVENILSCQRSYLKADHVNKLSRLFVISIYLLHLLLLLLLFSWRISKGQRNVLVGKFSSLSFDKCIMFAKSENSCAKHSWSSIFLFYYFFTIIEQPSPADYVSESNECRHSICCDDSCTASSATHLFPLHTPYHLGLFPPISQPLLP